MTSTSKSTVWDCDMIASALARSGFGCVVQSDEHGMGKIDVNDKVVIHVRRNGIWADKTKDGPLHPDSLCGPAGVLQYCRDNAMTSCAVHASVQTWCAACRAASREV